MKAIERAAPEAVTPEVSVHNVVYRCEDGRQVAARYDGQRAFLSFSDRSLTLNLHPSASGARYVGDGMQWWTRGMDQARLASLPEGETYQEADAGVLCLSGRSSLPAPEPSQAP
ncbi:Membrane-bound lysozyme-inhibitor of c-type lysozyme [compost metagenome]